MSSLLPFHPLANIFPLMAGDEFAALVADIAAHGLREPIIVLDGQILDGRNRMRACIDAGAPYRLVSFSGDDAVAFVVSMNLRRRHLDESQRGIVAAKLATLAQGRPKAKPANLHLFPASAEPSPITRSDAAKLLNVSERSVANASVVLNHATPALIEKVERGEVSVSAAADVAQLPEPEQREIVARGEREILQAAKMIRGGKSEKRRQENAALKAATVASLPDGKHSTIVIDPPWDMQKIERDVRPNQVSFDYPTMTEDELAKFGVVDMAADDCHLFCWTTHRFLPAALRLVDAWGFRYVLTMVWHKAGGFQPIGLPQYNCEFVVYARRGSPEFVDTKAFPCCFNAERREHSRKPDEFYNTIRRVTDGPRIDVFSREPRDGFSQFGNESGKFAA